jgi:DNA polymerase-3 subunit delta'
VGEEEPAFRKVAARAHPNLLALERPYDQDRKRYRTELTVSEIRRTVSFFGSTAAESGWRIAIVDPADDMNPSAANALLKILEEPPARAIIFVIGHVPGRLLPTIRSRCRRLDLSPLPAATIEAAILTRSPKTKRKDLALAGVLAEGSLRRAILLLEDDGIETYREMAALLAKLPEIDVAGMHGFADQVSGRGNDDAYHGFLELMRGWLARRVRREAEPDGSSPSPGLPLERWAQVWDKVRLSSDDAEEYNLDRKQVVLSIFMTLARETRM